MTLPYATVLALSAQWAAGATCAEIGASRGLTPSQASAFIATLRRDSPALFPRRNKPTQTFSSAKILRYLRTIEVQHCLQRDPYLRALIDNLKQAVPPSSPRQD